jgi:hypothetical protein
MFILHFPLLVNGLLCHCQGSTCIFCEAILRECGIRTGVFTSPHLIDVRERFRIDGLVINGLSIAVDLNICIDTVSKLHLSTHTHTLRIYPLHECMIVHHRYMVDPEKYIAKFQNLLLKNNETRVPDE